MEVIQQILVYLFLFLAVGYLFIKYFLPKRLKLKKAKNAKGCSSSDCGCS